MPEPNPTRDEWTEREHTAFLEHLDRRRIGLEGAMWQAPALTVAAQAFLLRVLTDRGVNGWARGVILVAGIAATLAAGLSLIRLRQREVFYSDAIAAGLARSGMPDPRPGKLPRKPLERTRRWDRFDKWLQDRSANWHLVPPMYLLWVATLVLFAVADLVAFLLTI